MTSQSTRMVSTDRVQAATLGALLIIFFLGMGLRLYQLDADSLWLDEIKTATTSRVDLSSVPQSAARTSVHPPLLYMVTNVFFLLLGNSDFVVRLPAALLGSASILLTYKAGQMFWSEKEGLAGAFLLAVSPYHIEYSQEARHYALMIFLALTSLILLIKGLETGRTRLWLGFAVSTSVALYTHYFAFLILPAEFAFAAWTIAEDCWSSRRESARAQIDDSLQADPSAAEKRADPTLTANALAPPHRATPKARTLAFSVVGSLVLIALSYIPWLPAMWTQITLPNMAFQGFDTAPAQITRLSPQFLCDLLAQYSGVSGVPLLLFTVLFILGLANCRRQDVVLILLWTTMPFLFLAFVHAEHWIDPRYAISILPIYLLVVARGLSTAGLALQRWGPRRMAPRIKSLVVVIPLAALLGLLQAPSLRDYYLEQKEDWRSAGQYLAEHLQPGDAVVAEGMDFKTGKDDNRVFICLPYYLSAYGSEDAQLVRVRQDLWRRLHGLEGWNGRLWGVVYHTYDLADAEAVQVVDFHQLSIVRLREPSGNALQDTTSFLTALLGMIPQDEAHFDIHLALADIYIRSCQLERAAEQLRMAGDIKPDGRAATDALDAKLTHFQRMSDRLEDVESPLWRMLGEELYFLGYEASPETLQAGDTLELTLWWRAMGDMDKDYTSFIHVTDRENRLWAQEDMLLQQEERPTSTWKVGDIVRQQHQMVLPADMPTGEYSIAVGVYYWRTGERLPVWDGSGRRMVDDVILLTPESER
jgi:mannosyltransferase